MIGQTFGHYRIVAKIGAGGMGEVYLAHDQRLDRDVALKVLPPGTLSNKVARNHFRKEALTLSKLNHPNIATVYDFDSQVGVDFLAMEHVAGQTLAQVIAGRAVPEKEVIRLGGQIGEALEEAHEHGVIHRDLKPANIMLTAKGRVKVLDFGLATLLHPRSEDARTENQIETGVLAGTLPYMAPEQLRGEAADARTDIYAAGAVLYEMATGARPFPQTLPTALVDDIFHKAPPPPGRLQPDLSPQLEAIIVKCLDKDPDSRYQSAKELLVDLRRTASVSGETERDSHATAPSGFGAGSRNRRVGLRLFLPALAILIVLVVALAVGTYWRHQVGNRAAGVSVPAGKTRIRSVAILPFREIGGSPEFAYFGTGLADVLSAKLTNAKLLEVHSPAAAWNQGDQNLDAIGEGRRLKVDAVLSGSYQIEAATLSISYTLVDVQNNVQIVGNAFTRPFIEAIQVEHLIASEIVGSLEASTSPEERARFTSPPTQQPDAFQAYLRSNYEIERFWQQPSAEQLARAEKPLQDALRLDPHFTLALVSLARLHWMAAFWGYAKGPEILEQAAQEAGRAIREDPGLGEAYAARALIQFQQGNLDGAEASLREAFSLSPNSALAYYAAGFYYLGRGLSDQSVRAFRRAKELDPQLVRRELTFAYRYSADFDQAEEQARQDLAQHPQDVANEVALVRALAMRGKLAEARKYESDVLRRAPADPEVQYIVSLLRALEGVPFSMDDWLNRYRRIYWSDGGYCANVAEVLAVSKQKQEALRWLRRAGDLGMRNYPFLTHNPLYENLRGDPDFQSYLKSVQLEWEAAKQRDEKEPLLPSCCLLAL